jgi:hypothetical protein
MDKLNDSIILQIGKYCDIDDLNNFSKINKYINSIRLYRLFYGNILGKRFGLSCINDVKPYRRDGTYKLNHFLRDIILCFNDESISNGDPYNNKYIYGYSSDWYTLVNLTLEDTIAYWKNKKYINKKLYKLRLCRIYRISILRKKLYKKHYGLNLLSIIY